MARVTTITCALSTLGCSLPMSYVVVPDDNVPQAELVDAMGEWMTKTEVKLDLGSGSNACANNEGCIRVHYVARADVDEHAGTPAAGGHTRCEGWPSCSVCDVWIANDTTGQERAFRPSIVTHELGHALGLVHQDGPDLMATVIGSGALQVTCIDAAQFYYVREMRAPSCP